MSVPKISTRFSDPQDAPPHFLGRLIGTPRVIPVSPALRVRLCATADDRRPAGRSRVAVAVELKVSATGWQVRRCAFIPVAAVRPVAAALLDLAAELEAAT